MICNFYCLTFCTFRKRYVQYPMEALNLNIICSKSLKLNPSASFQIYYVLALKLCLDSAAIDI